MKNGNKTLAPYIDAGAPKHLSTGPNRLDKPHFIDAAPKTVKEWENFRDQNFKGTMTAKELLAMKRKASPELKRNWDEAVCAWGWDFTLRVAKLGRQALTETNNPYGWYKGWTIESTGGEKMQKWMRQNMQNLIGANAVNKRFRQQWFLANAAADGNLIYDLLNTSN